jgi:hypothetical protein
MHGTSNNVRARRRGFRRVGALLSAVTIVMLLAAVSRAAFVWAPPVDISTGSIDVDVPRLAVDGGGDAVAVWYQTVGRNDAIMAAIRPGGGDWSSPVEVAAGNSDYGPVVGIDSHGDATVVWYQYDGSEDEVMTSTRPAGGGWSAPQRLSTPIVTGGDADEPTVAVDAAGDTTAVWYQNNGSDEVVMSATRPAGGSWSAPAQVSTAGYNAYQPRVAIDSAGDATAIWYQYPNGQSKATVAAARLTAGAGWSAPQQLSSPTFDSSEPQVAVDPAGDATAVWASYIGATDIVQTSTQLAGGSWSAAQQLSTSSGDADAPAVAVDGHGTATAVWDIFGGGQFVVQAASAPRGGGWTSPAAVSAPASDAGQPQIAADAAGDVQATWYRFNGVGEVVETAARPAGGSWTAAAQLSGSDAYQPQVGLADNGDAVAIWQLLGGGSAGVIQASASAPATGGGGSGGSGGQGGGTGGHSGGPGATGPPRLTALRLHPTTFRAAPAHGHPRAKTGTTISYRDSAPATTTLMVLSVPRRSCTPAQVHRRQCVIRGRLVGSFIHRDRAGANRFGFSGRIHGHALSPGRYRLVLSPRNRAGVGVARAIEFTVIR